MVGPSVVSCGYTLGLRARTMRSIRALQEAALAKPNYKFQKRQKDLAKQKKKEEKRLKKAARTGEQPSDGATVETVE